MKGKLINLTAFIALMFIGSGSQASELIRCSKVGEQELKSIVIRESEWGYEFKAVECDRREGSCRSRGGSLQRLAYRVQDRELPALSFRGEKFTMLHLFREWHFFIDEETFSFSERECEAQPGKDFIAHGFYQSGDIEECSSGSASFEAMAKALADARAICGEKIPRQLEAFRVEGQCDGQKMQVIARSLFRCLN